MLADDDNALHIGGQDRLPRRRGSHRYGFRTFLPAPRHPAALAGDAGCGCVRAEWYISSGCSGLFAVCQSSEMYALSDDERLELAEFVAKQVDGRAAVVATGNSGGGSIEEQAAFCNKIAPKVDAVVGVTCMLAQEDEDEEVRARCSPPGPAHPTPPHLSQFTSPATRWRRCGRRTPRS